MSQNNPSVKAFFPGLGLVFGAGAGILAAILWPFHIVLGIIGGAAAGLLAGLAASLLFGKGRYPEDDSQA